MARSTDRKTTKGTEISMSRTSEEIAHVSTSGLRRFAGVLCCTIAANALVASGYENDGPGAALSQTVTSPKKLLAATGSSFTPPKASDVQFVVTSGGDLGVTAGSGCSSHTIQIPLKIDRVFGDKKKLLANGGLPSQVTLRMIVWDVDSDSSYSPAECDEVFVNGHSVGFLQGHNETWTDNTFPVPTEILNLNAAPDEAYSNTIQVNVDVKNGGWITKVDWVSIYIPAPPPVVLSHGIKSSATGLESLKMSLEMMGLPVYAFDYSNHGNNGIAEGAIELRNAVKTAKARFNVESVNIVCHSMGGLKAREYAETCDDSEVMKILQIATPNAGSPIADFMLGLQPLLGDTWVDNHVLEKALNARIADPMVRDLSEEYLTEYNKNHPFNRNIWYGLAAGMITDISASDNVTYYITYKLLKKKYPANDAIVPTQSALTTPVNSSFSQVKIVNGPSLISNHSELVDTGVGASLSEFKAKLLERKEVTREQKIGGLNQLKQNTVAAKLSATTRVLDDRDSNYLKVGEVESGEKSHIPFTVLKGGDVVVLLSFEDCISVDAKLISPSKVEYAKTISGVVIDNESNSFNCVIEKPEVGEWVIECVPSITDNKRGVSLHYQMIQTEEDDGVVMAANFDSFYVKEGSPFVLRLQAKKDGINISGDYYAVVSRPDKSAETIVLKDDGVSPDDMANDGVYAAQIPTTIAGRYYVTATTDVSNPQKYSRMCLVSGIAYSNQSEISGASFSVKDSDGSGFYDKLLATFDIAVSGDATYRILAELSSLSGGIITEARSGNISCESGEKQIAVEFRGEEIFQYGPSDGYVISSVKLIEVADAYEAVVDEKKSILTTSSWKYDQFEHSALWIGAGGSETPTDVDGDGVYDVLNVKIPLVSEGALSGSYQWSAALVDSEGLIMGFTSGSVNFPIGGGTSQINLTYHGADIALSGSNGPYYVKNFVFWGNSDTFSLPGQFETRAYTIQQWGGSPRSADEPIISADIKWAYNVSSDSFFAQLNLSCTNGTPSQIGSIRYLFERRTSPEAYLCDKAGRESIRTITESSDNTSFNGRTFYYEDINLPELRTAGTGTSFKYGVQSEIPESGIVDRVPAEERKIGLWIAGRDALVDKATTEIANDYLGWLSWDANGKTNYIAVGNSAVKLNQLLKTAKLTSTRAVPPTVSSVNRALALGPSVLMDGSDPNCSISEFYVSEDRVRGTITLSSGESEMLAPGSNVIVKLYGTASLDGKFSPITTLTLDANGRFDVEKPTGFAFFKVLIEVVNVIE